MSNFSEKVIPQYYVEFAKATLEDFLIHKNGNFVNIHVFVKDDWDETAAQIGMRIQILEQLNK